jgi:hypothetical protein
LQEQKSARALTPPVQFTRQPALAISTLYYSHNFKNVVAG